MEHFVHDLPLPVDFQQGEQVGVPATGPVVEFKPHGGDRVNEVDAGEDPRNCVGFIVQCRLI